MVLLWTLGAMMLIALLGGSMATLAYTDARRADITERRARAELLAEAGFRLAALRFVLSDPDTMTAFAAGQALTFDFPDGGVATAVLTAETRRVDLNYADVTLLNAMFVKAGLEDQRAAALAAAVIDFRDEDDFVQLNGAERDEYRRAGLAHAPRNGPFQHVDDLAWVLGMDAATLERTRPYATVYSQQDFADGFEVVGEEETTFGALLEEDASSNVELGFNALLASTTFRIEATGRTADGATARLEVVFAPELADAPYDVRYWRRF